MNGMNSGEGMYLVRAPGRPIPSEERETIQCESGGFWKSLHCDYALDLKETPSCVNNLATQTAM